MGGVKGRSKIFLLTFKTYFLIKFAHEQAFLYFFPTKNRTTILGHLFEKKTGSAYAALMGKQMPQLHVFGEMIQTTTHLHTFGERKFFESIESNDFYIAPWLNKASIATEIVVENRNHIENPIGQEINQTAMGKRFESLGESSI